MNQKTPTSMPPLTSDKGGGSSSWLEAHTGISIAALDPETAEAEQKYEIPWTSEMA